MAKLRSIVGPIFRSLPQWSRREIRARRLEWLVRHNKFTSDEYEFSRLGDWLVEGDVAIDIGANFGSYTLQMSQLVGTRGRVFAFEPVPQTFAILVRLLAVRGCRNVTPLNLACSDRNSVIHMSIPDDPLTGENLYQSFVADPSKEGVSACCIRLDDIALPVEKLKLVKIDTEGHEALVISGMWNMLCRTRPIIIAEHVPSNASQKIEALGYRRFRHDKSPNAVFLPS